MPDHTKARPVEGQAGDPPRAWRVMTSRRAVGAGWIIWIVATIGIFVVFSMNPERRRTDGAYRGAAISFVQSEPMYSPGQHGWIYYVQSAMVYIPFSFEPRLYGELLWRFVGMALLASGLWRISRLVSWERYRGGGSLFLLFTILVIPIALGCARNGQINLHLAGLFAHIAADCILKRWNRAAALLALSLAAKPISIVPFLLFGAVYPALWWRLAVGVLVIAAMPFLHPNWTYVKEQYRAGILKVLEAGEPGAGTFAELTTVLRLVGIEFSHQVMTAIRAVAALAVLGIAFLARRRLALDAAAIAIWTLATAYLMAFSPRTEGNTYVILAPSAAVLACWAMRNSSPAWRWGPLLAISISLGIIHVIMPGGKDVVVRPICAMILLGVVAAAIAWRSPWMQGPMGMGPPRAK